MDRKRVGILIFNEVEVLDFCGPFDEGEYSPRICNP